MNEKKSTGRKPGHNSSDHGFVKSPKVVPVAPKPQTHAIRSSGMVPLHPSLAGQDKTIPWLQRLANLSDAKQELKLAKDALAVTRGKYGVDGVAPGQCANCGHPHHLARPLKLNLGSYTDTGTCDEPHPIRISGYELCLCSKSTLANEGQSAMYLAEEKVASLEIKVSEAMKQVKEPQPNDVYYIVKGFRSRNKFGWVVLTKDEGKNTKVLIEFKDLHGKPTTQKWFPLKKLKRSLLHKKLV